MDRARYHVRELVELERALVGDDGWYVSEWKPSGHDMLVWGGGEVAYPIETGANAGEAPVRAGMVTKGGSCHARVERLFGREVASLCLSESVERIVVNSVRHISYTVAQKSD